MFFDGGSSSRKISLRGKSKQSAGKDSLVKNTQKEREARLRAKLEQTKATYIQACYRSSVVRHRIRTQWRNEFDAEIQKPGCPTSLVVARLLLSYTSTSQDRARLLILCQKISGLTNKADAAAYLVQLTTEFAASTAASGGSEGNTYGPQLRRLFNLVTRVLTPEPSAQSTILIHFLVHFQDVQAGTTLLKETNTTLDPTMINGLYQQHLSLLIKEEFFARVREVFLVGGLPPTATHQQYSTKLLQLVFRPFTMTASYSPNLYRLFSKHILTIPALPYRLVPVMVNLLSTGGFLTKCLTGLPASLTGDGVGPASVSGSLGFGEEDVIQEQRIPRVLSLWANIMFFGHKIVTKQPNSGDRKFGALLTSSLHHVIDQVPKGFVFDTVEPVHVIHGDSSDSEDEQDTVAMKIDSNRVQLPPQMNDEISKSLPLFAWMIRAWTTPVTPANPPSPAVVTVGSSSSEDYNESVQIQKVVHVISAVIDRWPKLKVGILNCIAFSPGFLSELWRHVSAVYGTNLVLPRSFSDPVLMLFCSCYNHVLMITDDDEMFNKGIPLARDELFKVCDILKHLIFQICWNDITVPSSLMDEMSKLLQSLFDAGQRQQHIPESKWWIPELQDLDRMDALQNDGRVIRIMKKSPFLVPFQTRVRIFNRVLEDDRQQFGFGYLATQDLKISRVDSVFESAFLQLSTIGSDLKKRFRITFVNDFGLEEAGIDGGGLFKEFITRLIEDAFDPNKGLFERTENEALYPNPAARMVVEDSWSKMRFLGQMIGKSLYERVLIDVPFAYFFLAKMLRKTSYLNDLPLYDRELYNNLMWLKSCPDDQIEDLSLYFSVTENAFGEATSIDLVPGGGDILVTKHNKYQYITLVANYHLNMRIKSHSEAFIEGMSEVVPLWALTMFSPRELQKLIAGSTKSFDVDDLKNHATYAGGYAEEDETIQMFWEILEEFSTEQRQQFLEFVTSSRRAPLLGFKDMNPKFCIAKSVEDEGRLPTASTCMNLLKLPVYPTKATMKEKISYAISSKAGFEMS
eukprot:GFYU01001849.1.p1 GENE.GFYU01001849.1~~GFYU01001849.1.p1  ORF type:complete len:1057 (+),score=246.68 GFYU01001849.1:96-3173(+)